MPPRPLAPAIPEHPIPPRCSARGGRAATATATPLSRPIPGNEPVPPLRPTTPGAGCRNPAASSTTPAYGNAPDLHPFRVGEPPPSSVWQKSPPTQNPTLPRPNTVASKSSGMPSRNQPRTTPPPAPGLSRIRTPDDRRATPARPLPRPNPHPASATTAPAMSRPRRRMQLPANPLLRTGRERNGPPHPLPRQPGIPDPSRKIGLSRPPGQCSHGVIAAMGKTACALMRGIRDHGGIAQRWVMALTRRADSPTGRRFLDRSGSDPDPRRAETPRRQSRPKPPRLLPQTEPDNIQITIPTRQPKPSQSNRILLRRHPAKATAAANRAA